MRRTKLYVLSFSVCVLMASLCRGAVYGSAQTATPTDMPASLLVPDRFVRAVKNQSSAPSYLLATIVNDTTGERKRVCIESIQLYAGVRKENKLGRDDWDKIIRLILGNTSCTYHFTNPDAWREVQPRYTPEKLAAVREELRPISIPELAERFSYAKTRGIVKADETVSVGEFYSYLAATAYVLTERGLLAGRGDFGNSLYVITPQMLAEDDLRDRRNAEQERRDTAEGQAFAARLPGYSVLTKQFRVGQPRVGDIREGFCFSAYLDAISPRIVDSIDWIDPVNEKTGKARHDWKQFLLNAAHLERLARQHPWLVRWKATGPKRTIEAEMYGKNLHTESYQDYEKDIVTAWNDAGLKGNPYCQLDLIRRGKGEGTVSKVYLPQPGSGEKCSLIVSSRSNNATVTGPGQHWLDGFSFDSYAIADVRQVIVVTPSGDWKLLTLPTRRKDKKSG